MTTISNSTTAGITLSSPSDVNPIVVNPGVSVSGIGTAIYAPGGSWTIQNSGTISSAEAIDLRTGGSVTNAAVGSIKGTLVGVAIYGSAGTVVNSGGISGTTTSLGRGVYLGAGGSVTNAASASIRGGSGTGTTAIGVDLGAAGSVTNAVSASIKGDPEIGRALKAHPGFRELLDRPATSQRRTGNPRLVLPVTITVILIIIIERVSTDSVHDRRFVGRATVT